MGGEVKEGAAAAGLKMEGGAAGAAAIGGAGAAAAGVMMSYPMAGTVGGGTYAPKEGWL